MIDATADGIASVSAAGAEVRDAAPRQAQATSSRAEIHIAVRCRGGAILN
jgi:hypothetical protein